jgi:predicted naringenin-chalcone synthase
MSFIASIGIASPKHHFSQQTIASFMERAMELDYAGHRKLKSIFRSTGIEKRHSVLDDYGKQSGFTFYSNTENFEPFPSTEARLLQFRKHALPLSLEAVEHCLGSQRNQLLQTITHLIVVSCTGMYAPGLDIEIIKSLSLRNNVQRTCINFMGCYAAFNALKLADSICKADAQANVLIVCLELCTLHFQKEGTEDNLLANSLFADGAAAMMVSASPHMGWNLVPELFHNALLIDGTEHMAWNISNFGFEMKLSTYVPDIIRTGIKKMTADLLERVEMKVSDINHFAIHPGGKKILEAIESELGISKELNRPAYSVLSQYGNMSSVTIVFVLYHILKQLTSSDDQGTILSMAFGPGLTLESMLLKIYFHA